MPIELVVQCVPPVLGVLFVTIQISYQSYVQRAHTVVLDKLNARIAQLDQLLLKLVRRTVKRVQWVTSVPAVIKLLHPAQKARMHSQMDKYDVNHVRTELIVILQELHFANSVHPVILVLIRQKHPNRAYVVHLVLANKVAVLNVHGDITQQMKELLSVPFVDQVDIVQIPVQIQSCVLLVRPVRYLD